jgi:hypothetical protein
MTGREIDANNGYSIYIKHYERYKDVIFPPIDKQRFRESRIIDDLSNNIDFFGIFDKNTSTMIGFALNKIIDNSCEYITLRALPEYLKSNYPFYGLIYHMNEYYLSDKKMKYVSDGSRSITEHSNIQPFLEQKFKFRRAFCKLNIKYALWLKIIITILYPFRRIINYPRIGALLNQEYFRLHS